MEITDVSATKVSTDSWREFVEFPLVTVMSKYDEYNNAEGDNPQARRKWMGPVGDVVVEIETDAGITGYGQGNWATGAIATIVDETLSKLIVGEDHLRSEGYSHRDNQCCRLGAVGHCGQRGRQARIRTARGAVKDEIPCYASNLHPVDLETLEREAIDYVIQGFDAMYADAIYQHPPDAKNGVLQLPENVGLSAEPRSTRAFCGGVTMSDISFEYNIPVFPGALDACGDEPIHRDTPMYETLDWETTRAGIENAEALGFDAVWVPDHLMLGRNRAEYECWTLLSAIAGFTDDINVGSLVLCNDYRNPALVVKMAAILDVISGGRLELGIGAG